MIPLLLNGEDNTSFPLFIMNSTTVRIKEAVWREAHYWNGKSFYKNQGLHTAFFKLLKRLWVGKEADIGVLGEGVYACCLEALRSEKPPQSAVQFTSLVQKAIRKAQKTLINAQTQTLRILSHRGWMDKISAMVQTTLEKHLSKTESETERRLKEWYPTLIHRLAIQRISGERLPMESCYINLAVVAYQPKPDEKAEQAELKQVFYRLPSIERMENTNLKESIFLEDLFKPRQLKTGTQRIPKRILIRGRAGIGKTTLAKKSLHDHLQQGLWREHFEWLLWIPLRHLKGKQESYSLATLLYEEYFEPRPDAWDLAQALYRRIQAAPSKTLLICDGWDEMIHEKRIACLSELLNHPRVIITSRPYGINVSEIKGLDLELETLGFSEANVKTYLDHRDIVESAEVGEAIKTFINQHPFVRDLVNIPIQLDALCYSWDEINYEGQSASTMTALYEGIVHKLWRKDMVRLDKSMNGETLTEERVQTIPFRHLKQRIEAESTCLGALALNGLNRNQLEFKLKDLEEVIKQLEKDCHELPVELQTKMMKLSCLQVEKTTRFSQSLSYQFLHLTFQEFFAAQWLVECLREDKTLSLVGSPEIRAKEFIWKHQYNPRYEIVWWLMAGLLSGEALKAFFGQLNQGPPDLIGIQHQRLIMHCLKESNGKLPKEEQVWFESGLYTWVRFEVSRIDSKWSSSSLAREAAFPEKLLLKLLEEGDQSSRVKCVIANTLGQRCMISDSAVQILVGLCQDKDVHVGHLVAEALGNQSSLSPESVRALIGLSKDKNSYVRGSVARALGNQSSLSPEGMQILSMLSKDEDEGVRREVLMTLGEQWSLSSEGVQTLIGLLKDEKKALRALALTAFGKEWSLSPEIIQILIGSFKDEDGEIRRWVAEVLGKQSSLSSEVVQSLIGLLKDENKVVRSRAAMALGEQSSLSSEVVQALIRLLKDKESWIRMLAAEALHKESSLSPEVMQTLLGFSKDEDKFLRCEVAGLLGRQSRLSLEGMQTLIELSKDEDVGIRACVAETLGGQSTLPLEGVQTLIELSKDESQDVIESVAEALGRQSTLSPEGMQTLIRFSKDEDQYIRNSVVKGLGRQSSLSPEGMQILIRLSKDEDKSVRREVLMTLSEQSSLSSEGVQTFIEFSKDKDIEIRKSIVYELRRRSSQSPEVVQTFIELSKDEESSVRKGAVCALGEQSSLSSEGVQTLMGLLKDEDKGVRELAVGTLCGQPSLPPECVQTLIGLLEDEDVYVRNGIVHALRVQSVWGYRFLLIANSSFIKELYRYWLIPSNFKQVKPLYIEDKQLCFYTSKGLETIDLNEQEAGFRQAVLKAQQAVGIPIVSQINIQHTSFFQASPSYYRSFEGAQEDFNISSEVLVDLKRRRLG